MALTLVKRNKTWHIGGTNDFGVTVPRHSTKLRDDEAAQDYRTRVNRMRVWSAKALKEALNGAAPEAPAMTLVEARQHWLDTISSDRENTKDKYSGVSQRELLDYMADEFQITLVKDLKPLHMQKIQNRWVELGRALNTIHGYRADLSTFLKHCVVNDWIDANPWDKVKTVKRRRGEKTEATLPIDRYGHANWDKIRESLVPYFTAHRHIDLTNPLVINPEVLLAICELMYDTGLRRSDATLFEPDKIFRARNGSWAYRTEQVKTLNSVTCFLSDGLVKKLQALPRLDRAKRYPFWDGARRLKLYMNSFLNYPLTCLGDALGIDGLRPHRFRDSFAVNRLNENATLDQLQIWLGHKNRQTTERYYAPFVESREDMSERNWIAARLGQFLPPSPQPISVQ